MSDGCTMSNATSTPYECELCDRRNIYVTKANGHFGCSMCQKSLLHLKKASTWKCSKVDAECNPSGIQNFPKCLKCLAKLLKRKGIDVKGIKKRYKLKRLQKPVTSSEKEDGKIQSKSSHKPICSSPDGPSGNLDFQSEDNYMENGRQENVTYNDANKLTRHIPHHNKFHMNGDCTAKSPGEDNHAITSELTNAKEKKACLVFAKLDLTTFKLTRNPLTPKMSSVDFYSRCKNLDSAFLIESKRTGSDIPQKWFSEIQNQKETIGHFLSKAEKHTKVFFQKKTTSEHSVHIKPQNAFLSEKSEEERNSQNDESAEFESVSSWKSLSEGSPNSYEISPNNFKEGSENMENGVLDKTSKRQLKSKSVMQKKKRTKQHDDTHSAQLLTLSQSSSCSYASNTQAESENSCDEHSITKTASLAKRYCKVTLHKIDQKVLSKYRCPNKSRVNIRISVKNASPDEQNTRTEEKNSEKTSMSKNELEIVLPNNYNRDFASPGEEFNTSMFIDTKVDTSNMSTNGNEGFQCISQSTDNNSEDLGSKQIESDCIFSNYDQLETSSSNSDDFENGEDNLCLSFNDLNHQGDTQKSPKIDKQNMETEFMGNSKVDQTAFSSPDKSFLSDGEYEKSESHFQDRIKNKQPKKINSDQKANREVPKHISLRKQFSKKTLHVSASGNKKNDNGKAEAKTVAVSKLSKNKNRSKFFLPVSPSESPLSDNFQNFSISVVVPNHNISNEDKHVRQVTGPKIKSVDALNVDMTAKKGVHEPLESRQHEDVIKEQSNDDILDYEPEICFENLENVPVSISNDENLPVNIDCFSKFGKIEAITGNKNTIFLKIAADKDVSIGPEIKQFPEEDSSSESSIVNQHFMEVKSNDNNLIGYPFGEASHGEEEDLLVFPEKNEVDDFLSTDSNDTQKHFERTQSLKENEMKNHRKDEQTDLPKDLPKHPLHVLPSTPLVVQDPTPNKDDRCTHFLAVGSCQVKGCTMIHDRLEDTQKTRTLLEEIQKELNNGLLNKAVDRYLACIHDLCETEAMECIIAITEGVFKLRQFGRFNEVINAVLNRNNPRDDETVLNYILKISEPHADILNDALCRIFAYAHRFKFFRLTNNSLLVLLKSICAQPNVNLKELLNILHYCVIKMKYDTPVEYITIAMKLIPEHNYLARSLQKLLCYLNNQDLAKLELQLIKMVHTILLRYNHGLEAKAMEERLDTLDLYLSELKKPSEYTFQEKVEDWVKNGKWNEVVRYFMQGVMVQNDVTVVHAVHCALLANTSMLISNLRMFVSFVKGDSQPGFQCFFVLGQMITAMMLEKHAEKDYSLAYEILSVLHSFDINYYYLQKAALHHSSCRTHLVLASWALATPNIVALAAVDTCLQVNVPLAGFHILNSCNWARPLEEIVGAILDQERALRSDLLLKLSKGLLAERNLSEGAQTFKEYLDLIENDFKDKDDITIGTTSDALELFNNYLCALINDVNINTSLDLFEYFNRMDVSLDIKPSVFRALVILCIDSQLNIKAETLYKLACRMGIYKKHSLNPASFPHKMVMHSHLTQTEMKLALRDYLQQLFPVLHNSKAEFERRFSLHITLEEYVPDDHSGIAILQNISPQLHCAYARLQGVLRNESPGLDYELHPEWVLAVKSNKLYEYFLAAKSGEFCVSPTKPTVTHDKPNSRPGILLENQEKMLGPNSFQTNINPQNTVPSPVFPYPPPPPPPPTNSIVHYNSPINVPPPYPPTTNVPVSFPSLNMPVSYCHPTTAPVPYPSPLTSTPIRYPPPINNAALYPSPSTNSSVSCLPPKIQSVPFHSPTKSSVPYHAPPARLIQQKQPIHFSSSEKLNLSNDDHTPVQNKVQESSKNSQTDIERMLYLKKRKKIYKNKFRKIKKQSPQKKPETLVLGPMSTSKQKNITNVKKLPVKNSHSKDGYVRENSSQANRDRQRSDYQLEPETARKLSKKTVVQASYSVLKNSGTTTTLNKSDFHCLQRTVLVGSSDKQTCVIKKYNQGNPSSQVAFKMEESHYKCPAFDRVLTFLNTQVLLQGASANGAKALAKRLACRFWKNIVMEYPQLADAVSLDRNVMRKLSDYAKDTLDNA